MGGIFYRDEPPNHLKRCKIASALKCSFSGCNFLGGHLSSSVSEDEFDHIDIEDEYEVVESTVRSRFKEAKLSRKTAALPNIVSWAFFPTVDELVITPEMTQPTEDNNDEEEEEDFYSVGSSFSRSSSAASQDDVFSMKANFPCSSSFNGLDFSQPWRRSVIQVLCHCEGWPFGLCRKAVLLPPLPKRPSESWSWTKKVSNTRKIT